MTGQPAAAAHQMLQPHRAGAEQQARLAQLAILARWREAGWLRPLDLAFARFLHELDPAAPASLLGAAALLVHLQAGGHSCLPLAGWAEQAPDLLAWPGEAATELGELLKAWPADGPAAQAQWGNAGALLQINPASTSPGPSPRQSATPLVLEDGRLYLRRHWRHEREVAALILARCGAAQVKGSEAVAAVAGAAGAQGAQGAARTASAVAAREANHGAAPAVDTVRARTLLDTLFGISRPYGNAAQPDLFAEVLIDWQKVACAVALRSRFTIITGGPGTGKTFTAARLLALLQALHHGAQPLRVALAAPTGKAASRLKQSIDSALQQLPSSVREALCIDAWAARLGPAQTLHRLLGTRPGTRRFVHDATHPLELDLLIVDEASMVHLEMMAALLTALPDHARLVLLGDKDQLASVEAGAVLGDLCQGAPAYDEATQAWVLELTGQALPGAAGPSAMTATTNTAIATATAKTTAKAPLTTAGAIAATTSTTTATAAAGAPAHAGAHPALAQQVVTLRESRRFSGAIGRLAEAINEGDGARALALLRQAEGGVALRVSAEAQEVARLASGAAMPTDAVRVPQSAGAHGSTRAMVAADAAATAAASAATGGYSPYLRALQERPREPAAFEPWVREVVLPRFDDFRVLCALRDGPWGVAGQNIAIERALAVAGLLPQRRGEWYEGRPVMVSRNDAALGIFNGDIGIVLRPPGAGELRAYFAEGEGLRSVSVGRLVDVETAFALTVHKSQGSEFGHVVLVLPDADAAVLTRELLYTGVTRTRQALTVVVSDPARLAGAAARLTRRLGGLRSRL